MKVSRIVNSGSRNAEALRFGIVGCIAVAIQFLIYYLLVRFLSMSAVIATLISYAVSFTCNFVLSGFFTFKSSPNAKKGVAFVVSHVINLGLQTGLVALFQQIPVFGQEYAILPAMGICAPVNYFLVRFAFKSSLFQSA